MKLVHINGPYPYVTNTFVLISDRANAVIIDPAAACAQYEELLRKENAQLYAVMLTHGHHDHIAAAKELVDKGARMYMHPLDGKLSGLTQTDEYKDGEAIAIDDIAITPIFTPGHTHGSVCLKCEDMLFAGDTIFKGDVGRTDLEGGSVQEQEQSLIKLAKVVPPQTRIFPGHGEFTDMASELANNGYLRCVL